MFLPGLLLEQPCATSWSYCWSLTWSTELPPAQSTSVKDTKGLHCSRWCRRKSIKPMWVRQGQITHSTKSHGAAALCSLRYVGRHSPGSLETAVLLGGNSLHILADIYPVLITCQVCYNHNEQAGQIRSLFSCSLFFFFLMVLLHIILSSAFF